MYGISYFRNNLGAIAERLAARGYKLDLAKLRALDTNRRAALTESEQLKAQRNAESAEISKLRKQGSDTTERQQQMRALGEKIADLDDQAKAADQSFLGMLAGVPNLPHASVPTGKSAEDNVEVRRCGHPREFDFQPKAHWDLGPA